MKHIAFNVFISLFVTFGFAQTTKHEFSYASPESKGFSTEKLSLLQQHLENSGSSSMILMIDGDIIFEWGQTDKRHLIHSMRKALLNSLYGIAIENKQIDTSATLKSLNINDISPSLSDNELSATISDLLRSRSGIYHNAAATNDAMLRGRPERDTHQPGEFYYYNNWDFNALGTILEQQTGKSIYQLFYDQIAIPIGMIDYTGTYENIDGESDDETIPDTDGIYQFEKSKSKYPAYHFRMSARDLAIYGQLYLNHGNWNGKQIIPKEWIDVSTKPYSIYNPKYGNAYGMLWNVRVPDENTKRNSFFHTGVGIHMLGVYPDSKLVLVHRVDTEKEINYNQGDFYKMIGLVFGARK
ncbi:serine hydrolase [Aquimarina litoralis]|uniref:Serine hydrolase n=1 Tax=Aquimarina litoralis TaxID=584605 RepID=A0ABN1JAS2_9FLAO